ncbi:MAG: hypothetical protein ACP5M4_05445 [Acidobacteriaceae bacterium]
MEPAVENQQIVDHLASILAAPAFASSKRCRDFLSYIVTEAMEGRREEINERNIAHVVFGKSHRFEPSEDSLVRVKAHEVRRRLAQYYQDNPGSEFKIELPHGGYAPQFVQQRAPQAPAPGEYNRPLPSPPPRTPITRRKAFWYIAGTAAAAAVPASLYIRGGYVRTPLEQLWKPIEDANTPLLISIPVLKSQTPNGSIADRVGLGVAAAVSQAANFLNAHHLPYRLRFGSGLTFAQLREQPSLLLGGFTSSWSIWATKGLRYNMVAGKTWAESYIIDSKTGQRWQAENLQPDGYASADYGIVARIFDAVSGQILFVAAGITTFGTEGAASVLFDPHAFASVVKGAPRDWTSKNFQAVVKVSIIGTTPSTPEIIATHFW